MLLRDFVNIKMASADKEASAEGVPLTLNNCKKYKKMRDLKVYGNCLQDGTPTVDNPIEVQSFGELVTDEEYELLATLTDTTLSFTDTYYSESKCGIILETETTYMISFDYMINANATGAVVRTVVGCGESNFMTREFYNKSYPNQNIGELTSFECVFTTPSVFTNGSTGEIIDTPYLFVRFAGCPTVNTVSVSVSNRKIAKLPHYGKYKIPVVQRGKNLLSAHELYSSCPRYSALTEDGRSCVRFEDSTWINVSPISFKEKTSYTVSMYAKCVQKASNNTTGSNVFAFFYEDGTQLVKAMRQNSDWTLYTLTSDPAKTVTGVGIITYNWVNWVYVDANTFQFEEGSARSEYEPYVEPITTNIFLDEPLRKLSSYADYIDFKNNKVVRNVKEYNLAIADMDMDDESFPGWRNVDELVSVVGTGVNIPIITLLNISNLIGANTNGTPRLFLSKSRYGLTQTEWKTNYPDLIVQILLERITPKEEPLNITLPKLNAKTTIIEVDTSLAPGNISGKYILR